MEYFEVPDKCPSCNMPLVEDGCYLFCGNTHRCPAQKVTQVMRWIQHLDIEFIGNSLVETLVDSGKVSDPADLYTLTIKDIAALPGKGTSSATKIMGQIDKKRTLTLHQFLGGLDLGGFGRTRLKAVIEAGYDTLESIMAITEDALMELPGISHVLAETLVVELHRQKPLMAKLLKNGVTISAPVPTSPDTEYPLLGKEFKITGTLSVSRKEVETYITSRGGRIGWSKGGASCYLVTNELSGSAKSKEAESKGIPVISETQLYEMCS